MGTAGVPSLIPVRIRVARSAHIAGLPLGSSLVATSFVLRFKSLPRRSAGLALQCAEPLGLHLSAVGLLLDLPALPPFALGGPRLGNGAVLSVVVHDQVGAIQERTAGVHELVRETVAVVAEDDEILETFPSDPLVRLVMDVEAVGAFTSEAA
jgi:hypothetical protein